MGCAGTSGDTPSSVWAGGAALAAAAPCSGFGCAAGMDTAASKAAAALEKKQQSVLAEIENRVNTCLKEYEELESADRFQSLRRDDQAELTIGELAQAGRARVGVVLGALDETSVERQEVIVDLKRTIDGQMRGGADAERDARKNDEEADLLLDSVDERDVMEKIESMEALHSRAEENGVQVLAMAKGASAALRPLQRQLKAEIAESRQMKAELEEEMQGMRALHEALEKQIESKDAALYAAKQELSAKPVKAAKPSKAKKGSGADVALRDGATSPSPPEPLLFEQVLFVLLHSPPPSPSPWASLSPRPHHHPRPHPRPHPRSRPHPQRSAVRAGVTARQGLRAGARGRQAADAADRGAAQEFAGASAALGPLNAAADQ